MELIPIIKYALTMISAVSFVVVVFSYIMYKVKNAGKESVVNNTEQIINTMTPEYRTNIPVHNELQPIRIQREPAYIHERNFNAKKIAVKKPVQRFMVLNSQPEMQPVELATRPAYYNYEAPFTRQSFNLYNNYSANSAEPLHKFGV
jgi:hypothetical protein